MFEGHDLPQPPEWLLFDLLSAFAGRQCRAKILWLTATAACHLHAEFSTSCIGGERVPSKVAPETSLCDNDNGGGINRQLRVHLLNLEVTPATRISNSAVLEVIVSTKKKLKKNQLIRAEKGRSSAWVQLHLFCASYSSYLSGLSYGEGELGHAENAAIRSEYYEILHPISLRFYTHTHTRARGPDHIYKICAAKSNRSAKPSCKHYAVHVWPLCLLLLPSGIT